LKSAVIYYSKSGNTQKIAEAIATGMGTKAKRLGEVKPKELATYDIICLGGPVHYGQPDKVVSNFIKNLPELKGKKVGLFCTKSISGDKPAIAAMRKEVEDKGMVFAGSFCAIGQSRFFANFGPRIFHRGHPNIKELSMAEEFGRSLLSK